MAGGTLIASGASSFIDGNIISSGGVEIVSSGATSADDVVSSGGTQNILAGGSSLDTNLSDGSVIVGAAAELTLAPATNNLDSGTVYLHSGSLVISGAVSPTTVISNFTAVDGTGDSVDLTGMGAYSSATSYTVNGDLVTVTNGGSSIALDIAGATSGAYQLEDDGTGGILMVTNPVPTPVTVVVSGITTPLGTVVSNYEVQGGATEFVFAGGTIINNTVDSGATSIILSSGLGLSTIISTGGTEIVSSAAMTSNILIEVGGTQIVDGGRAVGTKVSSGGLDIVSAGVDTDAIAYNGGTETILSGASALSAITSSGGVLLDLSGGYVYDKVILTGGIEILYSGATANFGWVSAGGTEILSGGQDGKGQYYGLIIVSSGATFGGNLAGDQGDFNSGSTEVRGFGGTTINNDINLNATQYVQSGGVAHDILKGGNAVIDSGGLLTLSANTAVNSGTVMLSGGKLVISGHVGPVATVSGFSGGQADSGESIDLTDIGAYSSATTYTVNGDRVTVTNGGSSIVLDIAGATSGAYQLEDDGNGGILMVTCFLEGTLIEAGDREIPVENIHAGDPITVLEDARPVLKPVKWVGQRSVRAADLPADDAHPVRIIAHAFAAGMPRRDLLVTPEHCLFVEGYLIPARMLVNHRSIIIDRTISSFTYYHIELERHGILLAEGLPAESYLDTGNRGNFANAGAVALRPDFTVDAMHKNWTADAAAPLTVDRSRVEPVWRRLDERGQALGHVLQTAPLEFTDDPDLHLATQDGLEIWPMRRNEGRYTFMIPSAAEGLRLRSRAARPADTIGPFVDDRRRLGVKIGEMALWHGSKKRPCNIHLDRASADGWLEVENNEPMRWTNGDASLKLMPNPRDKGMTLLEINIAGFGLYKDEIRSSPVDNSGMRTQQE